MDIGTQLALLEKRLAKVERSSRLSSASLDDAAILVRDSAGTLRATVGVQDDGTAGIVAVNGPPPGAPTAPLVTPSIAGLRVTWDGKLADGSPLPADFDHIAVYVSDTSGADPSTATFAGAITRAGDGGMLPVTPLPYAMHYVRLVAVNTSGIGGAPSSETAGTPVQVDGPDLSAGSVTAGAIAAGAVEADKLEAILVLATRILAGSPSGARVELNSSGLRAYDGAGNLTVSIDAGTGGAAFTGAITGSTVSGSTVTGGVLQTNTSGSRVVITPSPPAGVASRPSALLYSGVTGEVYPAVLNSGPSTLDSSQAVTNLAAPVTSQDSSSNYTYSAISLSSPRPGFSPGRFQLSSNNPTTTSEIGYTVIDAQSASTTAGSSSITLLAKDGNSTSKQSSLLVTGDHINLVANGATSTFNSTGLTIPGTISARNTPYIVTKSANTDRTSTTTRTADPDLTMNLVANATYIVEFHIFVGGSSFALVVTEWLVPSGATGLKGAIGPSSAATETTAGNNNADGITMRSGSHGFSTTVTYGRRNVNTNLCYAIETGTVTTTSSGTLALAWAQSTSSTTFNRVGQGSFMRVTRIA